MSVPHDIETDCAGFGRPGEGPRNKESLRFDPKYRHLKGSPSEQFDSQDSGIGSYRSVDSGAVCLSTDSSRAESLLSSTSGEQQALPLSQRLENIHISGSSSDSRQLQIEGNRTGAHKSHWRDEAGDEAFVEESFTSEEAEASRPDSLEYSSRRHTPEYLTDDAFDQDQEGDTPLHLAIIHKQDNIALRFIGCTKDQDLLNIQNCLAQTPLHLSVLTRQPHICRALVLAGAQIDSIDRNGDTPLHIACKLTDDSCIRALTEGISPLEVQRRLVRPSVLKCPHLPQNLELKNFEGFTCVHILGFLNNQEHLSYLVSLGADINAPDGKSGRTALHYSVEMDNLGLAGALIQLGADVDALTYDLCTPLHLAVGRRFRPIAQLLLVNLADTDIANFEGDRPCDLSQDGELGFGGVGSASAGEEAVYSDIRIQGQ